MTDRALPALDVRALARRTVRPLARRRRACLLRRPVRQYTIPIPGAVSGGMVGVLLAFGAQADLAPASVLAYRGPAIWLPAPIGLAALGALQRTIVRWTREDAPSRGDARRRNSPHSLDSVPVPAWPVSEPALHGAA